MPTLRRKTRSHDKLQQKSSILNRPHPRIDEKKRAEGMNGKEKAEDKSNTRIPQHQHGETASINTTNANNKTIAKDRTPIWRAQPENHDLHRVSSFSSASPEFGLNQRTLTRKESEKSKLHQSASHAQNNNGFLTPPAISPSKKMNDHLALSGTFSLAPNKKISPCKTRNRIRQDIEGYSDGLSKCSHCNIVQPIQQLKECPNCESSFHFSCMNLSAEAMEYLMKNPKKWQCPRCKSCAKCKEYITDPGNAQCMVCTRAWHSDCIPRNNSNPRPEYPYNNWTCFNCRLRLEDDPRERQRTPQMQYLRASMVGKNFTTGGKLPKHRHEESTRSLPLPRNEQQLSSSRIKWKEDQKIENGEIMERRKTRSFTKITNQTDNAVATAKQKELRVEDKIDIGEVHARDHQRMPSKTVVRIKKEVLVSEDDEEEEGWMEMEESENALDEDIKPHQQRTAGRKKHEMHGQSTSSMPVTLVPNSPKSSRETVILRSNWDHSKEDENEFIEQRQVLSEMGFTTPEDDSHKNKRNKWLQFGRFVRFQPLYESAYEEPIQNASTIYVCEFCLAPMAEIEAFGKHLMSCKQRFPPGNEIYRDPHENWNIWEVEGQMETNYCRNLCLMAKLFLSSKTLFHEVDTFTFYILTEITPRGCVMLGYFSKEINPSKNNNLSCLLTLPNTQARGYGKLLIDLSYQLSKLEHKIGSPEHPLSDLGLQAYRSYWRAVLFSALRDRRNNLTISIRDLSIATAIHSLDIVSTLLVNQMLSFRHDTYYIDISKALNANLEVFRRRHIRPDQLKWLPPFEPNPHSKMNSYVTLD